METEESLQASASATNNLSVPACFKWTERHDVLLCRELLLCEPYKFKSRSRESGQAWEFIANHLNAIKESKFRVKERSVRDRAKLILKNYELKLKNEEKASGIDVQQTELEELLEEVLAREKLAKSELDMTERQKQKDSLDKQNAEEIRNQAMEKMGETKKRKSELENGEPSKGGKKSRRSCSDAIQYLQMKADKDYLFKKEELEQRKREKEAQEETGREAREDQRRFQQQQQDMLQQMHHMTMQFMQQSQQQNQALLSLLNNLNYKKVTFLSLRKGAPTSVCNELCPRAPN